MRIALMTAMPDMRIPMGSSTVDLTGSQMSVDVVGEYRPATPDSEEGPGDDAAVRIDFVVLRTSLALHDTSNVMTLVISAGTDMLELLPERAIEAIGEQCLAALREEGRAG